MSADKNMAHPASQDRATRAAPQDPQAGLGHAASVPLREGQLARLDALQRRATGLPWVRANLANVTTKVDYSARMYGEPAKTEHRSYRPVDDDLATEAVNALPAFIEAARLLADLCAAYEAAGMTNPAILRARELLGGEHK